jgi:phospholipid/cholesterol/gamma-HCH transport system substrate-binding protein
METRARYLLIGLATILGTLALLGSLLWLAKVQLDRTYEVYDILFDSVEGLGDASPVLYAGVNVGRVLDIALDPEDPGRVRVRIEVLAETPVRTDTVATLASQGVTGVSYVSLAGNSVDAPPLEPTPPDDVAVIRSERSLVQGLITDAPDLLSEALSLLRDLNQFTSIENRQAFSDILRNVESLTRRADTAVGDLEDIMASVNTSAEKIAAFSDRLDRIGGGTEATLDEAEAALAEARGTFERTNTLLDTRLPPLLDTVSGAVRDLGSTMQSFRAFAAGSLPEFTSLATEARSLVGRLRGVADQIARDPGRFILGNQTPAYRR